MAVPCDVRGVHRRGAHLFDLPAGQFGFGGFTWAAFLVQFGAAAAYALGWAPYVSDYSRYLPPQTSPARRCGSPTQASSSVRLADGPRRLVAALFADASPLDAVNQAADGLLPGSGHLAVRSRPCRG